MSLFLSEEEVVKLTRCVTAAGQIMWLKANKVRHHVNAKGKAIVTRSDPDRKRHPALIFHPFPDATEYKRKAQILDARPCGIYMLMTGADPTPENIKYIGRTTNLFQRLASHMAGKAFTHVFFIPMKLHLLDIAEREYIARYKPQLNTQYTTSRSAIFLDARCDVATPAAE